MPIIQAKGVDSEGRDPLYVQDAALESYGGTRHPARKHPSLFQREVSEAARTHAA